MGEDAMTPAADENDQLATITPYRDGPYLVRGRFELVDQDGNRIEHGRRTIALCRCGRSQIRPLCDGTHRAINFHAPSRPEPGSPPSSNGRSDDASAGEQ
jgi:CDGSH-type Zn-finger protein